MKVVKFIAAFIGVFFSFVSFGQPWSPDLGNGNYKNPIIYADYSDPDVISVGEDFYMVASSFNCTPYDGLFVATADHPSKKWTLKHIVKVDNWEDPCPLWDDDGNAYLVRSKLCGNALYLHKMSNDGMKILDNGIEIFRDKHQPTIEGPKFLKKDGYYYIFAPAGGVTNGWQTVLRSQNIYGPFEFKEVLHSGNTDINGPHQGGVLELESGEWWFIHFQDKDMYGRIVHLQPMSWSGGWPLIGVDQNNDAIGEPIAEFKKPDVGKEYPKIQPQTSDEFDGEKIGLQWQWHANFQKEWYSLDKKKDILRLNSVKNITQNGNFWYVPNLLMQKFPAPEFTVTTKVSFNPDLEGEQAGLVVMGNSWGYISIIKSQGAFYIRTFEGIHDRCDEAGFETGNVKIDKPECYFRLVVKNGGMYQFSYSFDNERFILLGRPAKASKGRWIGAKVGLFCLNPNMQDSMGFAEFEWFRIK